MSDLHHRITRELTLRTMAVLAVLGALAVVSFLALAHLLASAEGGAQLVEVAGRQRMLVERAALAASRLSALPPGSPERAEAATILSESLEALEGSHMGLLAGMPEIRGGGPPSEAIRSLLVGPSGDVDVRLRAFVATGREILGRSATDIAPRDPAVSAMTAEAFGPLLAGMDAVTRQYRDESSAHLVRLSVLQGIAVVTTLAVLLLAGGLVFRPMVRRIGQDVQDRCRAEEGLRDSEERLWRILEESPVGVSASRRDDGKVVFANTRFCEILGARREDVVGSQARDLYVDANQRAQVVEELKKLGRIDDAEVEFRRFDGSPFQSLLTIRPTQFGGEAVNLAWVYDISAIKVTEEQLKLAAKVVETASEAVVITDAANRILFVNPAFTAITEYTPEDVLGRNPAMLQSGRHDGDFYRKLWADLHATGRWRGEIWNRRKSGEFFAEWLSIVAITDGQGRPTHHIAVFSDITHRKEDEERVWRQANYDALTGLPNRSLFLDRLDLAIRQGRREGRKFALMFIDLDGFKQVNDTLGHAAGDILLQRAGERLGASVRASDTVARLAGDEFTVIVQGIEAREDAAVAAAKIIDALGREFDLDGRPARVRASVGIAIFPNDGEDGAALLTLADQAMYGVKRSGKNNFAFAATAPAL